MGKFYGFCKETALKAAILGSLLTLCMLILASSGRAQQSSASVTGLVKDSTGANITGAQVKLNNVETNVVRQTTSNNSGNYAFLNVPPGRYTLEFSAKGFQSLKINPF